MAKIRELLTKYRELIVYVICGALTTAVDFSVYLVLTRIFSLGKVPANITGTVAAIIFAFFVNKWLVFLDKKSDLITVVRQFVSFASMRVLSMAFQTFCLWLFAERLGIYDMAIKLVTSVVVVILNYIFSKLMIFKNKNKEKK